MKKEYIMKVWLNKKEVELPADMTVAQLIKEKQIKKAAVWINGKQLLSAEYESHGFQEGDQVKILRVVAGG
jgi:thiamine biosynthesis protein ThiS